MASSAIIAGRIFILFNDIMHIRLTKQFEATNLTKSGEENVDPFHTVGIAKQ
jgi:hypothetical protein